MEKCNLLCLLLCLIVPAFFLQSCKNSSEGIQDDYPLSFIYTNSHRLYFYPAQKDTFTVKIEYPMGGTLVNSKPAYSSGWNIIADAGNIVNSSTKYLLVEDYIPDNFQTSKGWVVGKDSLKAFFTQNLNRCGFNQREADDFVYYWVPQLTDYPYYIIYPQFKTEMEGLIKFGFSSKPDNFLRVFYIIKGLAKKEQPGEPVIPEFKRDGFVVAELGLIIKQN